MLIEVEPACGAAVRSSLSRMSSQGLRVAVLDTQPWLSDTDAPRCREGVTFTGHLHATGLDQAGILIKITELLAQQELDITSIQCNQHQQSSLGACAHARAHARPSPYPADVRLAHSHLIPTTSSRGLRR